MPRVKGGNVARKRRKKILKLAKGYYGSKHTLYKTAHEQVMHSLSYAYRDRKQRKRNFRKLWITRINAATRLNGMSYSKFMHGLSVAEIDLDRKVLAELAVSQPSEFSKLVEEAKKAIENNVKKPAKKEEKPAEKKVEKPVEEKVVEEEAPAEVNTDAVDLESMNVADLKALAKERGIDGYSKLKKAELIDALK